MLENNSCHHETGDIYEHLGCVSLVPIFNHLEPEQMKEIMQVVRSVSFKKGETIYYAGDTSNSLYIVNKGQVKIYHLSEDGKEQIVRLLNHGDFTGELALFQQSVHEAYAEAMVNTQICMINGDELEKLLLKYPTIAMKILSEFSNRLANSERQTMSVATERVETRLALYLADLFDQLGSRGNTVTLPMSKKDLASFLGTTPETLSRRLADFEAAGYIQQQGQRKIKVLDIDELLLV
ncbi:MAG TPA: Crp/Fnr family transcriptional regulator [Bacillota bacterium]|nr:Crp/Fnr family transcriptional regulator [Bacillota bacterium]